MTNLELGWLAEYITFYIEHHCYHNHEWVLEYGDVAHYWPKSKILAFAEAEHITPDDWNNNIS